MRLFSFGLLVVILAVMSSAAQCQVVSAAAAPAQGSGKGMAAVAQAATAQKYLFVFFWREQNAQTDQMWKALEAAAANLSDRAMVAAVSVTDPAERAIVERYGVSRAPMPLVLSIAPCGAITKAFPGRLDENQLRAALVSPCTEKCMKALQERKLVLLCVQNSTTEFNVAAIQGVQDFKADQQYAAATEVVYLNSADQAEASFLQGLQVDPQKTVPVTVFMAPPGTIVGKFEGSVTKDQLVAKLASAQSSCCPGGKCGPGGCGPKR
jgi:hypothetical protein